MNLVDLAYPINSLWGSKPNGRDSRSDVIQTCALSIRTSSYFIFQKCDNVDNTVCLNYWICISWCIPPRFSEAGYLQWLRSKRRNGNIGCFHFSKRALVIGQASSISLFANTTGKSTPQEQFWWMIECDWNSNKDFSSLELILSLKLVRRLLG